MACSEKFAMYIASLVLIALALILIGISLFRSSDADSITRFCITATPDQVIPSSGEMGGLVDGMIQFDTNTNLITYILYYNLVLSPIQSVVIRGPRSSGQSNGPITFSLCGAPNLVDVCDILSIPGQLSGTIKQLQPGALDNRPVILDIRANPFQYYVEILTASHPVSPGGLRAPLNSICGFP